MPFFKNLPTTGNYVEWLESLTSEFQVPDGHIHDALEALTKSKTKKSTVDVPTIILMLVECQITIEEVHAWLRANPPPGY